MLRFAVTLLGLCLLPCRAPAPLVTSRAPVIDAGKVAPVALIEGAWEAFPDIILRVDSERNLASRTSRLVFDYDETYATPNLPEWARDLASLLQIYARSDRDQRARLRSRLQDDAPTLFEDVQPLLASLDAPTGIHVRSANVHPDCERAWQAFMKEGEESWDVAEGITVAFAQWSGGPRLDNQSALDTYKKAERDLSAWAGTDKPYGSIHLVPGTFQRSESGDRAMAELACTDHDDHAWRLHCREFVQGQGPHRTEYFADGLSYIRRSTGSDTAFFVHDRSGVFVCMILVTQYGSQIDYVIDDAAVQITVNLGLMARLMSSAWQSSG